MMSGVSQMGAPQSTMQAMLTGAAVAVPQAAAQTVSVLV